ncbi:hypothetical protein CDD83_1902 [Cordyceps sp. RAO-2017]|nr:hypothetical protein CDD83_1902 [Cordyceps sp. RAO-2017]
MLAFKLGAAPRRDVRWFKVDSSKESGDSSMEPGPVASRQRTWQPERKDGRGFIEQRREKEEEEEEEEEEEVD